MFWRHCAIARWLADHTHIAWLLFVDADIGVINANHLVEDFVPRNGHTDLVFYQRIFNGEIASGSYLVRNSEFSINFLHYWANYEDKLPWSWHGSDNGAIHVSSNTVWGQKDVEIRGKFQKNLNFREKI